MLKRTLSSSRNVERRFAGQLRGALWGLAVLLLLLVGSEREARAYADPGSGALIWQMLVAGFVGAMFYFRRFTTWFKTRKKDSKD